MPENNKNFLNQNKTNFNSATEILKKDFTIDYSDYEKLKINSQYNKLYTNIS